MRRQSGERSMDAFGVEPQTMSRPPWQPDSGFARGGMRYAGLGWGGGGGETQRQRGLDTLFHPGGGGVEERTARSSVSRPPTQNIHPG